MRFVRSADNDFSLPTECVEEEIFYLYKTVYVNRLENLNSTALAEIKPNARNTLLELLVNIVILRAVTYYMDMSLRYINIDPTFEWAHNRSIKMRLKFTKKKVSDYDYVGPRDNNQQ